MTRHLIIAFLCLLFLSSAVLADEAMIKRFYDPDNQLTSQQITLLEAAVYDKQAQAQELLDSGVIFDWKLKAFKKAWGEIILNRRLQIIRMLLDKGMDINAIDLDDNNGRSALMIAAVDIDGRTLDLILSKDPVIDLEDKQGDTALFLAVWSLKNIDNVKKLIAAGADVNHADRYKRTPLLQAIERDNQEAVEALLDAKADIEYNQRPRETPLVVAAGRGYRELVALLLKRGAKVDASNPRFGITPLMAAASNGQAAVVKLLLEHGADPSITLPNGSTALSMAAAAGHGAVVQLLMARQGGNTGPDVTGKRMPPQDIFTQMTDAANQGHRDVLSVFLNQGYDINAVNAYGETLLTSACKAGQLDVVRLLLERGAGIEIKNQRGETPVDAALWKADAAILRLLLERGAQKPMRDINDTSPLLQAVYSGNKDLVQLMLDMHYDINQQDHQGMSPLHVAAAVTYADDPQVVQLLLDHGAAIDAMEGGEVCHQPSSLSLAAHEGATPKTRASDNMVTARMIAPPYVPQCETPLLKAVAVGHRRIVQLLVERGADVNFQSPVTGTTPLMAAAYLGDPDIVRFLLSHQAKVGLKDKEGQDAAMIARKRHNTKALALLGQS